MKKADEFRIGLWTIISIVVLVFGIKYLKGQLHTTTSYYMLCTDVDGLAESSHVKVNGFNVGYVRSMDYDYKNGKIIVELNIDPDLHIPTDSHVNIAGDLLGSSNVVLSMGQNSQYLQPGDTLFGGNMLPSMLDQAGPTLSAVTNLIPKIDTLLGGLNVLINESKMQESLLEINVLTLQLHRTLSTLNSELPSILNNVGSLTANLDTVSLQIKQAKVDEILHNADATLNHVNQVLEQASNTNGTTGKLINTTELHDQLTATLQNVDSLVNDIKANPKRYINIKVFGK